MDLLAAFIIVLALITIASIYYRISPFFTLIGGAILFGLLAGMTLDTTIKEIVSGAGKVFSAFGIIIFCGAVIAAFLQEQHQAEEIVADIRRMVSSPPALAGFSGWFLSVPITCCVTAYIMLVPILECIEQDKKKKNILLYLAAVGSIVSYSLIFPTPAVIPLFTNFAAGTSALFYDAIAIPLSLAVLVLIILFFRWAGRQESGNAITGPPGVTGQNQPPCAEERPRFHGRAWGPFIAIVIAIPVSFFLLGLSHVGIMNVIMLAGAGTAIALAPHAIRSKSVTSGAKHAGLIIFDICGAGALGYVIVHSGFTEAALLEMTIFLPVILVPFIIAAILATAQGSRVTTAVITAEVLAGSVVIGAIHPVSLILLVAAGSCIVSYVTDPFFWIVQRTTGDSVNTVVKNYTLPIALAGIAIFVVAVLLEYLVFN